jgi:phage terminase large subunit-like protein
LFFPLCLKHTSGEWAGEPFELSGYQMFACWQIQGWRSADDKTRRFRKLYLTVARKNGKTTFGAGLGNLWTYFDWPIEVNGRGYCSATKKPQAALLWSEACRQVQGSPSLAKRTKIQGEDNVNGGRIIVKSEPYLGSTIETIGADALRQDGLNPSWVIKDELHAWRKGLIDLDEKLSTGGASRLQPIEAILTTAGDDDSEIWIDEHNFAEKVLEAAHVGEVIDDTYLAIVFTIDPDDDPLEHYPKANPNLGISVREKYLKSQVAEATLRPTKLNSFTRYHANARVGSYLQSYPPELWERGLVPEPIELGSRAVAYGGMDLGRTDDWAAVTFVLPEQIKGEGKQGKPETRWKYKVVSRAWACEGLPSSSTDYTREPFATWIRDGLLEFQRGEILDYDPLKAWIVEIKKKLILKRIAYDKTYAHEVAADLLNDYGVTIEDYPQTYAAYTEPIKSFERALRDGRVEICDPVLTWQAMNCETVFDPSGRMMLDKGNAKRWRKIDGVVALLMAYSEAIYDAKKKTGSGIIVPTN